MKVVRFSGKEAEPSLASSLSYSKAVLKRQGL